MGLPDESLTPVRFIAFENFLIALALSCSRVKDIVHGLPGPLESSEHFKWHHFPHLLHQVFVTTNVY